MMSVPRLTFAALTGPRGRRSFMVIVVAGAWAWWLWAPVTPQTSWAIPAPPEGNERSTRLIGGARFAIHWTSKAQTHSTGFWMDERLGPMSIRDLSTGQERLSLFADDLKAVIQSSAPDGSWLLALDGRSMLRLLATADGRELAAFPPLVKNGTAYHWTAVSSPDGRILALDQPSPGPDEPGAVRLWDVSGQRELSVL